MSTIHVISENDLQHIKRAGGRIRTLCPIHHSRDRDLSINPYIEGEACDDEDTTLAGYGHCHSANCGATVLVQEWNPRAAERILGRPVAASSPRIRVSGEELAKAEKWQEHELAALHKVYADAQKRLAHSRAQAYLAQRGIADRAALDVLATLGVAYLPPVSDWRTAPPRELAKWCDRLIFPFTSADGQRGYIGRTLERWAPGMDENEHKKNLVDFNEMMRQEHEEKASAYQIQRWRKTYMNGFINAPSLADNRQVYLCEGPFDVVPLLLAGLPGLAIAGTHLSKQDITFLKSFKRLYDVTLAFDRDTQGKEATELLADRLRGIGIETGFILPPDDETGKDWSERYRVQGLAGLAVLVEAERSRGQVVPEMLPDSVPEVVPGEIVAADSGEGQPVPEEIQDELAYACCVCGADVEHYSPAGIAYCAQHWPGVEDEMAPGADIGKPLPMMVRPEVVLDAVPEHATVLDVPAPVIDIDQDARQHYEDLKEHLTNVRLNRVLWFVSDQDMFPEIGGLVSKQTYKEQMLHLIESGNTRNIQAAIEAIDLKLERKMPGRKGD